MDNSIENIWKKGFVDKDALIAPMINDLYNRKSNNLIDKFQKMFKINRQAIFVSAAVILLVSIFFDAVYFGLFMCASLLALIRVGNNGRIELDNLDKGLSSYEYLKSFVTWRHKACAVYANAYRVFYPLFFIATALQMRFTEGGALALEKLVAESNSDFLILGLPIYLVVIVVLIAVLLSIFAGPIYRLDLNLVYGPSFRKLDDLITEMESLRI